MPEISISQIIAVCFFAFLAGLIDSIAGGGGLIQLPAMLAVLPNAPVVMLLSTNKLASSCGTGMAIFQYSRKVPIHWKQMLPIAGVAFCAGVGGALTATHVPNHWMRPLVTGLLVAVLIYTLLKKDLGDTGKTSGIAANKRAVFGLFAGVVIGFYDGFFGPGTGNFLILVFIFIFGLDFLQASASSKVVNLATNIGALFLFVLSGYGYFILGLLMAVFNMAGAVCGVQLAVLKGSKFIRILFIVVVSGLILKQIFDFLI
ncbi:MAG: sulfite exporter TauE/SafE family protein [Flexilinea sp.]